MWKATIKKPGGEIGWQNKFETEAEAQGWLDNHKGPGSWGGNPAEYLKELFDTTVDDNAEKADGDQRKALKQKIKALKKNDLTDVAKCADAIADIIKVIGLDK